MSTEPVVNNVVVPRAAIMWRAATLTVVTFCTGALVSVFAVEFRTAAYLIAFVVAAIILIPVGTAGGLSQRYIAIRSGGITFAVTWIMACSDMGWVAPGMSPFHPAAWLLLVAVAMAGVTGAIRWYPDKPSAYATTLAQRLISPKASQWCEWLVGTAKLKMPESVKVTDWTQGNGEDVAVTLAAGQTIDHIRPHLRSLASVANLPSTSSIQLVQGARHRDVTLKILRKESLSESTPYPAAAIRAQMLEEPKPLGNFAGGAPILFTGARQSDIALLGVTGGGKSGCLDCLIAGLGLSIDTLVGVIDFKGDCELGRPWIYGFKSGALMRSPLEAMARNRDEAMVLLRHWTAIMKNRHTQYADLKQALGVTDIPVSPNIPMLHIIVDESKQVADEAPEVMHALTQLQRTARAAGCRISWATTNGMRPGIPLEALDQVTYKAVLGADMQHAGQFAGWKFARSVDFDRMRTPEGELIPGMIAYGKGEAAQLGRTHDIRPQKQAIAALASKVRPEFELWTHQLPTYEAYARRWDYYLGVQQKQPEPITVQETIEETPMNTPGDVYANGQNLLARLRAENAKLSAAATTITEDPEPTTPGNEPDPVINAIAAYLMLRTYEPPVSYAHIARHLEQLGITVSRDTITGRLNRLIESHLVTRPQQGYYQWKEAKS